MKDTGQQETTPWYGKYSLDQLYQASLARLSAGYSVAVAPVEVDRLSSGDLLWLASKLGMQPEGPKYHRPRRATGGRNRHPNRLSLRQRRLLRAYLITGLYPDSSFREFLDRR